jgi:hypothetical protein
MTGLLLISAHILDPCGKLRSFWKWDKAMDNNPENTTLYTTQYQEAVLKYVENKCCAKYRSFPVTKPKSILANNLISSGIASRSGQSSDDPCHLSSDHEEHFMQNNLAETTPRHSDCAAR